LQRGILASVKPTSSRALLRCAERVVIVVRGLSESGMNPMKIEIAPLNDHALQRIN
jgi:hypothetical protein